MFRRWIVAIVGASARYAWFVVLIAAVCTGAAVVYTVRHVAIDTDTTRLLSNKLPWRQREARFDAVFPHRVSVIAVVVDGATPELAELGARSLTEKLRGSRRLFRAVWRPDGGPFFENNGLLFLAPAEVERTTAQLIAAQPLLGMLAADPSVRGLLEALSLVAQGAEHGQTSPDVIARPLAALADTLEGVLAGRFVPFSLRTLIAGGSADPRELRRFILVQPALDFTALQPGAAATDAIRRAARELGLDAAHGVRVRLTGEVPLADEEFSTLADRAALNAGLTILSLVVLLGFAVRSGRIMLAIMTSLVAGLAVTAAFGLLMFGAFNLISIAFAVLFLGLGIDFGIQFSVAYRARRYAQDDLIPALTGAAADVGGALALAAAATAAGFYAFLPTEYRGVSELGAIAGTGMIVAFGASITVLPALLRVLRVGGEKSPVGYAALAPLNRFLIAHRTRILTVAAIIALASAVTIPRVRFDFNPLHLRSPDTESVATVLDLMRDPQTTPNTIEVLAPSLSAAQQLAQRLAVLPQVSRTITLADFIPEEQEQKLAIIGDAALLLEPTLTPTQPRSPPADAETRTAMQVSAGALESFARSTQGAVAADALRVSRALSALAQGNPQQRAAAAAAIDPAIGMTLDQLRASLGAGPVTLESLPKDLIDNWRGADGSARVEIYPRGTAADNQTLQRFVEAVRTIAPDATGAPVSIQESGATIVRAFIEAGLWALLAVVVLLTVVLRRLRDVLLTLAPLMFAGAATLALCVAFGIRLNFENIIALPLLLGIGVAFNIYFVTAWRAGATGLLQSSLARAVIFSALTTASAFGSLWFSHHPGTASMGKLLALSLACTLAATLLVLPALLGPAPGRESHK